MKTLIIYNDLIEELKFLIVEGDYSRFNGVCVNSMNKHEFTQEFLTFFFNDITGDFNFKLSNDITLLENKEWNKVAITTFLP